MNAQRQSMNTHIMNVSINDGPAPSADSNPIVNTVSPKACNYILGWSTEQYAPGSANH